MEGSRRLGFSLVLVGVMGLVLLGLAEGTLRLAAGLGSDLGRELARRDPHATLRVPHGRHGYRQRPGAEQVYGNGARATSNAAGYRGPVVAREKPLGVFRIVLLGGSATHGWGVEDDETIDTWMRAQLALRGDAPRVEIVNLALDGYDSYQVRERLESEGVPLDPDLVIVNAGVNDVRNARFANLANPDPRTLIWEAAMRRLREEAEHGPSLWTRLRHTFYLARLPAFLRERMRAQAQAVGGASETLEPNPEALDYFETNVDAAAGLAVDAGAAVLLSVPPSSLTTRYESTDTSPRDYWIVDAATTQAFRDRLADRMRRVAERRRAAGEPVAFVAALLPSTHFLDDCHLTPKGNAVMAEALLTAADRFLPPPLRAR